MEFLCQLVWFVRTHKCLQTYHTVWYCFLQKETNLTRATQNEWLEQGLIALHESGVDALTIDLMCQRLGVTKGSFYHHFANRTEYLRALLTYWEERYTSQFIAYAEQGDTPLAKMRRLTHLIVDIDSSTDVEATIRLWAFHEPMAREFVERVDRRRIDYVRDLGLQLTGNAEHADTIARIAYAILVGSQYIMPPFSRNDLAAMYAMLEHLQLQE